MSFSRALSITVISIAARFQAAGFSACSADGFILSGQALLIVGDCLMRMPQALLPLAESMERRLLEACAHGGDGSYRSHDGVYFAGDEIVKLVGGAAIIRRSHYALEAIFRIWLASRYRRFGVRLPARPRAAPFSHGALY